MEIPTHFPRKNRTAPVNPKVELTQSDYNRLVQMAQMKAKKIEERAREIYEKEGVTKIDVRYQSLDISN